MIVKSAPRSPWPQISPRSLSGSSATAQQNPKRLSRQLLPADPRYRQSQIDKWIRDRLIDWRDRCWRCRKPIIVGQLWTVVSNGEVTARFHQD